MTTCQNRCPLPMAGLIAPQLLPKDTFEISRPCWRPIAVTFLQTSGHGRRPGQRPSPQGAPAKVGAPHRATPSYPDLYGFWRFPKRAELSRRKARVHPVHVATAVLADGGLRTCMQTAHDSAARTPAGHKACPAAGPVAELQLATELRSEITIRGADEQRNCIMNCGIGLKPMTTEFGGRRVSSSGS